MMAGLKLEGRRLLVVGGGTRRSDDPDAPMGNGRAIALQAAREGAAVAVSDLDLEAAEDTAEFVRACGTPAFALQADAADPGSCTDAVAWAAEVLGGLDALVCNVGIGVGAGLEGTSVDEWDTVMAVNVRAHFLTLKAALPLMPEGSAAVLVSSVAGLRPGSGIPAYDASKAAQVGLMRQAAKEAARRGVRVNAVAPGLIDTPLGRLAWQGARAAAAPRCRSAGRARPRKWRGSSSSCSRTTPVT